MSWTVTEPADVAAALTAPALRVVPPACTPGPAARLLGRMARFSDGEEHRRRRELIVALLPPAPVVAAEAAGCTAERLAARSGPFDVMPLARLIPATALACALGLASDAAVRAAELTGRLCDALPAGDDDADAAASGLLGLLGAWVRPDERTDAAASILFQARDATAALIGLALLGQLDGAEPDGAEPDCAEPGLAAVRCTWRTAVADVWLGGASGFGGADGFGGTVLPAGAAVEISLESARAGAGPHACPASEHAAAIAAAFLAELDRAGWQVAGQPAEYEPRPNLRLPRQVIVSGGTS